MRIEAALNRDAGTMSVTYRGETREFPAHIVRDDFAVAYNVFSARFKNGTKLWPCAVTYWLKSGNAVIEQGGFSNKGGARGVVGWWTADSANNTQYHGAR